MKNKIIFNVATMIQALEFAKKAMFKNPAVPILEEYLLKVKNGVATIIAGNLQTFVKVSFNVEMNKNSLPFACTLDPTILAYLKKVELQPITLVNDPETYAIEVFGMEERAKYAGQLAEDYPIVPEAGLEVLELTPDNIEEFTDLLNYVSKDELRPAMASIHFGYRQGKLNLVATDGHMLKVVNLPEHDEESRDETLFNLNPSAAKMLQSFKLEGNVKVFINDIPSEQVGFRFRSKGLDVELVTRNIDERYPDYYNVIPENNPIKLNAEKKAFMKVNDKAMLFANKTTNQVRLSMKRGVVRLSAEDLDFAKEFNSAVPSASFEGDDLEIGFNAKFLNKFLDSHGDTVTIELSKPNRAAVARSGNSLTLCMPVMLNQYVN